MEEAALYSTYTTQAFQRQVESFIKLLGREVGGRRWGRNTSNLVKEKSKDSVVDSVSRGQNGHILSRVFVT